MIQVMAATARARDPASMARPIPVSLEPDPPEVVIDAALVAPGLGLDVDAFRQQMDARKVQVLCERGTGEDDGLFRVTFYHQERRVRLVVDRNGIPVQTT